MTTFFPGLSALSLATLLLLVPYGARCEEPAPTAAQEIEVQSQSRLAAGYRSYSLQGDGRKALPYAYLRSHPYVTGSLHGDPGKAHISLDLGYFNPHDYLFEGDLDYAGLVRAKVRFDGLFHNLDHLEAERPAASVPWLPEPLATFSDQAPGAQYGVAVDRSEVGLRMKTGNYPAHVNINYWRFEKSGHRQLRFVDENCSSCHMQSRSRGIDSVTEEVSLGVDAHLGSIDLGVEQLVRELRHRQAQPVDFFGAADNRIAGNYQHDAIPDAQLVQTTVKMHTSLAGGVVGSASASLGQRKNLGDLTDVQGTRAETDFRKWAGDLTVSTSPRWSASFRYRMLDLENRNSSFLTSAGAAYTDYTVPNNPIQALREPDAVRAAIDLNRATYSAALSYRPFPLTILKGDYQLEEVRRDQVGEAQPELLFGRSDLVLNPYWTLPADEKIQTFRLSLLGRSPDRSKLRINSWYQWRTSDDPSYAASDEEAQEGFLGITCAISPKAGGTANLQASRKENNQFEVVEVNPANRQSFHLDRRQDQQSLSLGLWWGPAEGVLLTSNYGFLRDHTEQDLIFGDDQLALIGRGVDYAQQIHHLTLGANWQFSKVLTLSAEVHQVRSQAEFSPEFFASGLVFTGAPLGVDIDSSGLKQLSAVSLRQFGWNLGADWRLAQSWALGLRYAWDEYEDRTGATFDGRVQTTMVSAARSW